MNRNRVITIAAAAGLVLGPLTVAAWMLRADDHAGPCVVVGAPAVLPGIAETSGLAISRRTPGVIWTHNDSGNDAVLFALDTAGRIRGRVHVPIQTRDWEDISAARCPPGDCLYLADIGDNKQIRARVRIYRLAEPAPDEPVTAAPDVFDGTYDDGPHNAEAMFVAGADLFIVTRDRLAGVYRATIAPSGSRDLTFRRIGALGLAAVTDAEAFRDGASVVVRTSHEAVFYRTADLARGANMPYFRIRIDGLREPQGEGIAADGHMLFLSSEGRPWTGGGRFISLRCELPQ